MKRNRLTYVVIIATALIMVYFEKGRMSFSFLYAVLLMPAFSVIISWLSLYSLSIAQTADMDLVIKGEELILHLTAFNKGIFLTPVMSFSFIKSHYAIQSDAEDMTLTLPARSKRDVAHTLSCNYRGVYYIGLQSVEAVDFLGLFRLTRRLKDKTQLVVYPRVVEIASFPLSMNLLSKSYSRYDVHEEDYSAMSDVRPYQPTDSMKRIHWKLSARRNSFIVKNYENTALNSAVIYWDRLPIDGGEEYRVAAEDKIVELVVAEGFYCLKKRIPVDMYYGAGEPLSAVNIDDFEKLYACAAHALFDQNETIENSLTVFLNAQSNQMNLTVITSNLTETLYDKLTGAFYFGHHVILLYIPPEHESVNEGSLFDMLKETGMNAYRIDIHDDIHDFF